MRSLPLGVQIERVTLRHHAIGHSPQRPWGPLLPARQETARTRAAAEDGEEISETGRDERIRRLESVLFLAREPLPSRKLGQYANLADATEARTLVRRLNQLYDTHGRSFRVEEVAGGFQLLTRAKFSPWLRRLERVPSEVRLSAPAMETLAVVAYRQPTARAEIEAIRGVSCGEILRQLMERDLVRISGRSEELGRPYLYGTTKQFLQLFGLKGLDRLPRAEELRGSYLNSESSQASPERSMEEDRQVAMTDELDQVEELRKPAEVASDEFEDDDFEDDDADDDEDDDFEDDDDFDDDDDDYDDDFDDDDADDDEEEDEDGDYEDDEWEVVEDDEEEDDDDEDDDDEDWGEEEDDDDDDEEDEDDEDWGDDDDADEEEEEEEDWE